MKDFLYLDTDYLDSYLSQINNGLIERTTDSVTDQTESQNSTKSSEKGIETEVTIEASGGLPGIASIKGNGKTKGSWKAPSHLSLFAETEIGQSIIAKTVHDDAFNALLKYIKSDSTYDLEIPITNQYYCGGIDFNIMDLNYYLNLFTDEDIKKIFPIDFDINQDKVNLLSNLDQEYEKLNRDQRRERAKEYTEKKKEINAMKFIKPSEYPYVLA